MTEHNTRELAAHPPMTPERRAELLAVMGDLVGTALDGGMTFGQLQSWFHTETWIRGGYLQAGDGPDGQLQHPDALLNMMIGLTVARDGRYYDSLDPERAALGRKLAAAWMAHHRVVFVAPVGGGRCSCPLGAGPFVKGTEREPWHLPSSYAAWTAIGTLRVVLAAPDDVWALWDGHTGDWTPTVATWENGPRVSGGGYDGRVFAGQPVGADEEIAEVRDLVRQAQAAGRISPGDDLAALRWTFDR